MKQATLIMLLGLSACAHQAPIQEARPVRHRVVCANTPDPWECYAERGKEPQIAAPGDAHRHSRKAK